MKTPFSVQCLRTFATAAASGSIPPLDPGITTSIANIAPRPRTSAITGYFACKARKPSPKTWPICWARAIRPSSSIVAIAPSAAAQDTGLPPNVPPRPPAWTLSMISARAVTPAIGSPPPKPLAVVTMSGTTPSCSIANMLPVRAKPVWTSSAMKTMPFLVAYSQSPGKKPFGGVINPPSP